MEMVFVEVEISCNENAEVKSKPSWIKHFCSCCCQCCNFSLLLLTGERQITIMERHVSFEVSNGKNGTKDGCFFGKKSRF